MRNTLDAVFVPLMAIPSIKLDRCAICGRRAPLNQHHIVRRGAGKLFDENGKELEKPTITLCGFGNHLPYCHALAHHQRLHFRATDGQLEYLISKEPMKYIKALSEDGWRRVRC